jgi:hypothetical protein
MCSLRRLALPALKLLRADQHPCLVQSRCQPYVFLLPHTDREDSPELVQLHEETARLADR